MEFEKEIIDGFVVESREHLSSIEDDLLSLEKLEDQAGKNVVNKVFRAIHTIKGAAGFLGLEKIGELSHQMETLLSMIRSDEIAVNSELIDILLEGVDLLKVMLDDIEHNDEIETDKVVKKLKRILSQKVSKDVRREMKEQVSIKNSQGNDTGFSINEYTHLEIKENKKFLYILKYDLEEVRKTKSKSPIHIIKELLEFGEIIDGKLETPLDDLSQKLEEVPLYYDVLYTTGLTPNEIQKLIGLSSERVEMLMEGESAKINTTTESQIPTAEIQEEIKNEASGQKTDVDGEEDTQKGKKDAASVKIDTGIMDKSGTVRIHVNILDQLMNLASELVLVRNQQLMHVDRADSITRSIVQRLDLVTSELQETVMRTRMQPIGNVFGKYPRFVRDLSKKLGKKIEIKISGNEVELDKTILESLTDPLTHLVRNSCDHGIENPDQRKKVGKNEMGLISLNAVHEAGQINIEIKDDGKGIDPLAIKKKALEKGIRSEEELSQMNENELISLISLPGFSTTDQVSDLSGRGVGMDVVKSNIERLNGNLHIESQPGKGTTILLKLPLTLAIIPCLIVVVGDQRFAIPQVNLEELVSLYDQDAFTKIQCAEDKEIYRLRDTLLPLLRLSEILADSTPFTKEKRQEISERYRQEREEDLKAFSALKNGVEGKDTHFRRSLNFAVLKVGAQRFGMIIDKVLGTEEIVVKPMHPLLRSLKCYSGATVMGDGRVALILDVEGIAFHTGILQNLSEIEESTEMLDIKTEKETQTLLLFKVGDEERFALALPMIQRVERIATEHIEKIGPKEYINIEGVSTLILRLDQFLNVSPCAQREEMFLILPKFIGQPFGLLASSLVDIMEKIVELNTESYKEDGLLGTAILNEQITLFIDIYRLIEKAEPTWFDSVKQKKSKKVRKKIRVLVAEDASFFREVIRGYLKSEGFEVSVVENGALALEMLEKEKFELLVSDLEMPVMDGWTLIQKIRSVENLKEIPSIALTSLDSNEDREYALSSGFDRYELKLDRTRMLSTVNQLLESRNK